MKLPNAVEAYLVWFKVALVSIALIAVFSLGFWFKARIDGEVIAKKDGALREAGLQLNAAADALRAQKKANQEALDAEKAEKKLSDQAGKAAAREAKQSARRAAEFKKKYEEALKNPDCNKLLQMDLAKVCKL